MTSVTVTSRCGALLIRAIASRVEQRRIANARIIYNDYESIIIADKNCR